MSGKRRAVLSRLELLRRYAAASGSSDEAARAVHAGTDIDDLRAIVESWESGQVTSGGARRSFARSQPTTTVKGQTR